ncbi:phosphopantetheinyl transferase [Bradyrhizobium barranii subsp. barranii]
MRTFRPGKRRTDALGWLALVSLRKLVSHPAAMASAEALLCGEEEDLLSRAQTSKRRVQFVGGRLAGKAAVVLCRVAVGEAVLRLEEIEIGRAETGAPQVRCVGYRPAVSISHSLQWAVALSAPVPCGIDVEDELSRVRASDDYFDRLELGHTVRDFGARCAWTAKEAVAKIGGRGLDHNPHSIRMVPADGPSSNTCRVLAGAGASGPVAFAVAFSS